MTAAVPLHLRRFGTGPRQALALHCTLSHGGAWRGLGGALAQDFTLLAPDLPGHGRSGDWDGKTDLQDACLASVQSLVTAATDVIGHSFGATIALRLAVERPDLVRRLVLIEPVLFAAARLDDPTAFEAFEVQSAGYSAALAEADLPRAARRFTSIWGDGRPWQEMAEKTRDYITERMYLIQAQDHALIQDGAQLLALGRLEALDVPVLFLRGGKSPAIIAAIHRALSKRLPNARESVIPDAAHMLPITHPEAVAAAIRDDFRSG